MNRNTGRRFEAGTRAALFALLATVMLSACASPRIKPNELIQARARLEQSSADVQIATRAPIALLQAKKLVDGAELAFLEKNDTESVFLATLAAQRVEIAEQHAQAVAAKAASEQTIRKLETVRVLAREAQTNRSLLEARGQIESAQRKADDLSQRLEVVRSEAQVRETQAAWAEAERSRNQLDYWLQRQAGTNLPSVSAPPPAYRNDDAQRAAERIAIQERDATRALSERMAALERSQAEAARRALQLQDASAASVARVRELQNALDASEREVRALQTDTDRSADRLRALRSESDAWTNRLKQLELENSAEKARIDSLGARSVPTSSGVN